MLPPLLQMAGHEEHRKQKNSKQETDQNVLLISHHKAFTKRLTSTIKPKSQQFLAKRDYDTFG